jgi:hypothetical protein
MRILAFILDQAVVRKTLEHLGKPRDRFSCQRRGFCPSCAAKRGALFGALLAEEIVDAVYAPDARDRSQGFSHLQPVTKRPAFLPKRVVWNRELLSTV